MQKKAPEGPFHRLSDKPADPALMQVNGQTHARLVQIRQLGAHRLRAVDALAIHDEGAVAHRM